MWKSVGEGVCVTSFPVNEWLFCALRCSVEHPAVRRLGAGCRGEGLRPLWSRAVRWDSGIWREPRRDWRDHAGCPHHERVKTVHNLFWGFKTTTTKKKPLLCKCKKKNSPASTVNLKKKKEGHWQKNKYLVNAGFLYISIMITQRKRVAQTAAQDLLWTFFCRKLKTAKNGTVVECWHFIFFNEKQYIFNWPRSSPISSNTCTCQHVTPLLLSLFP